MTPFVAVYTVEPYWRVVTMDQIPAHEMTEQLQLRPSLRAIPRYYDELGRVWPQPAKGWSVMRLVPLEGQEGQ